MKYFLLLIALFSLPTWAGDLSPIAGRYVYDQYQVTLPRGRTLGFKDLNARSADLDLRNDAKVVLYMKMLDGSVARTEARIIEAKVGAGKGYWLAQWPDMDYPVLANFKYHDDVLEYTIKFENPNDKLRYGSMEKATLRKTKAF